MYKLIEEGIIEELKKGDKNASQLKQSIQFGKEAEFWAAISTLEADEKIKHYFAPTRPSATLAYRLATTTAKSAPIPPWRQEQLLVHTSAKSWFHNRFISKFSKMKW